MFMHHTITVILFLYAYYTNMFPWAVVVLMGHDLADLFLSLSKWWREVYGLIATDTSKKDGKENRVIEPAQAFHFNI